MTLRTKTVLAIALTIGGLLAVLWGASRLVWLRSIERIELDQALGDVQRAVGACNESVAVLSSAANDWAAWDDDYAFVQGLNPAFRSTYIDVDSGYRHFGLNALAVFDREGRLLVARTYDLAARRYLPDDTVDWTAPDWTRTAQRVLTDGKALHGIVATRGGPMIIAAQPVLPSIEIGLPAGVLVFGRWLGEVEIARIAHLTDLDIQGFPPGTDNVPADLRDELQRSRAVVQRADEHHLTGYAVLEDLEGRPALVLRVNLHRPVFIEGESAARNLLTCLLGVGLAFGALLIVVVDRGVLKRLRRVSGEIDLIRVRDLHGRVTPAGSDELGAVATSLNALLDQRERDRSELVRSYAATEQALAEVRRRDAILFAAQRMLLLASPEDGAPEILERLGQAAGVRRVFLLERGPDEGNEPTLLFRFEWVSPGQPQGDDFVFRFLAAQRMFERWSWRLARGETIQVNRSHANADIRELLAESRIESVFVVPVHAGTEWWGAIGYEDARPDRTWDDDECEALVAAAGIIGAALARHRDTARLGLLASALESAGNGIAVFDRHGTAQWINAAFSRMCGLTRAEAIGRSYAQIEPEGSPLARPEVLEGLADGGAWRGEVSLPRADGEEYVEDQTITSFKDGGDVSHYVVLKQDATERKKAERELLAAKQAAEQAAIAKGEFLATMSHEIRTPMNGIIGMTDLALDTPDAAEQRSCLAVVRSSAQSLLGLLNDVLAFSQLDSSRVELRDEVFELRKLVTEVLRAVAIAAEEKRLHLVEAVAPDVPAHFTGDPARLRQALGHLVGNAVKFTDRGRVVLRVAWDGVRLGFEVEDTGVGIAPEKRPTLFQPFTQADGSNARRHGGTGLGLATVSRLAGLMRGTLEVASVVDEGSTFTFSVPLEPAESPDGPPAPCRDGCRVLVVESDPVAADALDATLSGWNAAVTIAPDEHDAIDRARSAVRAGTPFDLVLVDDDILDEAGVPFIESLARECGGAARILLLASPAWRPSHASAAALASGRLIKPAVALDLLDVLRALDAEPAPPVVPESERPAFRVLLAEDNAVNRALALRILQKAGHRVTVAVNGREAVECAELSEFDVVLMDMQMPEMDGLEATRALRQAEAGTGRRLPIIAVTANAMDGDRERCLLAGMDDYVSKPLKATELLDVIERNALVGV